MNPTTLKKLARRAGFQAISRLLLIASSALLAGCGLDGIPNLATYPVKGKVLLADGKPLTTGRVYFHRQEDPPIRVSGVIGPDGSFELTTRDPGDGAPPGRYRVQIDPVPDTLTGASPRMKIPRIPVKYTDEGGLGLTVVVQAASNELEPFRLK